MPRAETEAQKSERNAESQKRRNRNPSLTRRVGMETTSSTGLSDTSRRFHHNPKRERGKNKRWHFSLALHVGRPQRWPQKRHAPFHNSSAESQCRQKYAAAGTILNFKSFCRKSFCRNSGQKVDSNRRPTRWSIPQIPTSHESEDSRSFTRRNYKRPMPSWLFGVPTDGLAANHRTRPVLPSGDFGIVLRDQ